MSFEIRRVEPEPGAPITVKTLIKYTPPLIRKEPEVVIPSGVEFIGKGAFEKCETIKSVKVESRMTGTIQEDAFRECRALERIELPFTVAYIGDNAFRGCTALTDITTAGFGSGNSLPNTVRYIGSCAFAYCESLKELSMYDKVNFIGDGAFCGCSSLEKIEIPYSVETIGAETFSGCSSLKRIKIPDSVKTIGENAFFGCKDLKCLELAYEVLDIMPEIEGNGNIGTYVIIVIYDTQFYRFEYESCGISKADWEKLKQMTVEAAEKGETLPFTNYLRSSEKQSPAPAANDDALLALKNSVPAYNGGEPYIFISYAHKNAPEVLPVLRELKSRGYRFWYDEGIEPGTAWRLNIADNVAKCAFFIALISDEYVASSFCKEELYFAEKKQRELILVHLKQTDMPNDMDMAFSWKQQIMSYELPEPREKTLVDALEKLSGFDKFRE